MGKHSQFPWDLLKAECLRLVCSQLVQASNEALSNYPGGGRKEDMIDFLRDVETSTLDAAVENLQNQIQNLELLKSNAATESPSAAKRTRANDAVEDEDPEGYNTRFKGVKRVKVREEKTETPKRTPRKSLNASTASGKGTPAQRGRGRPRKSIPERTTITAPLTSDKGEAKDGETSAAGVSGETSSAKATKDGEPNRGRGRPRKSDSQPVKGKAAPKPKPRSTAPAVDAEGNSVKRGRGRPRKSVGDAAPLSKSKEIFDGVHLQKRKTEAKVESGAADGEKDGEGEEEDAVLAAVNGHGFGDGASSLGGSNKENDPDEAFRYATDIQFPDHDVDMDADGDPDAEAEQTTAAPVAAA